MLLQPGPPLSADQSQQPPPSPQPQLGAPPPGSQPGSGLTAYLPLLASTAGPSSLTSSSSASSTPPIHQDVSRYLDTLQDMLKEGWTAHTAKDGRLYYC
ncbi:hypothetical protein pipiens_012498, partial [Culex pipiens pipiens]